MSHNTLVVCLECWALLCTITDEMIIYEVVEMCIQMLTPLICHQDPEVRYSCFQVLAVIIEMAQKSPNFVSIDMFPLQNYQQESGDII